MAAILACASHAVAAVQPVEARAFAEPTGDGLVRFVVGVEVARGWSCFWLDAGRLGLPTRVSLDLPDGARVVDLVSSPPSRRLVLSDGVTALLVDERLVWVAVAEGVPPENLAAVTVRVTGWAVKVADEGQMTLKPFDLSVAPAVIRAGAKDERAAEALNSLLRSLPKRPDEVSRYLEAIEARAEPAEVRPGQRFRLVVQFTVRDGLHVQAHRPLSEWLIPCDLFVVPQEGFQFGEAVFPAGQIRQDKYLGRLREYTGRVRITVPGRVLEGARSGQSSLAVLLRFQACSEKGSCFRPQTVRLTVPVRVIAAGSAAPATSGAEPRGRLTRRGEASGQTVAPETGRVEQPPVASGRLPWEPFSPQRLAEATSRGRTVLIDFTAAWCPNCKWNEATALNTREVAEMVRRNRVVCLLADYTHYDEQIEAWLKKFGSISVPLTVVVPGRDPLRPIVLRDIYSKRTLLKALEEAGPSVDLARPRQPLTLESEIVLAAGAGSLWLYLLFALVGGVLMNFLPCVLPVVSIKVLSLAEQVGDEPGRVLSLALAFAAGMLAVFAGLGASVTVAGTVWGAWFQSRTFLAIMLGIIVAMAANLFGAFTLTVPRIVGRADAAVQGEGLLGSFAKGMLAVFLGTPCSGPFLGATMAWAAREAGAGRPAVGLLVFLSMGVGMALPFVLLALRPGWMRYMPKPGAWMETFRQFMGFLMLLTGVYLLYILGGEWAVGGVLFGFGVALACWVYGRLVRPGGSAVRNWLGRALAVGLVGLFAWAGFGLLGPGSSASAAGQSAEAAVQVELQRAGLAGVGSALLENSP